MVTEGEKRYGCEMPKSEGALRITEQFLQKDLHQPEKSKHLSNFGNKKGVVLEDDSTMRTESPSVSPSSSNSSRGRLSDRKDSDDIDNEGRNDISSGDDSRSIKFRHSDRSTNNFASRRPSGELGSEEPPQQHLSLHTAASKTENLLPSKLPPKPVSSNGKLNSNLRVGRSRTPSDGARPPRQVPSACISSSLKAETHSAFVPIRRATSFVSPSPPPSPRSFYAYPIGPETPSPRGRHRRVQSDSPMKLRHFYPSPSQSQQDLHASGAFIRQPHFHFGGNVPNNDSRIKGSFGMEILPQHALPSFRISPQSFFVDSPQLIPSPVAMEQGKRRNGMNFLSMAPPEADPNALRVQNLPPLPLHPKDTTNPPKSPTHSLPLIPPLTTNHSDDELPRVNSRFFTSSPSLPEKDKSNDTGNDMLIRDNSFTPMVVPKPASTGENDACSVSIQFLQNLNCHTAVAEGDQLYRDGRYHDAILCYSNVLDSLISRVQDRLSPDSKSCKIANNAVFPPKHEDATFMHDRHSLTKIFLGHLHRREQEKLEKEQTQPDSMQSHPSPSYQTSSGNRESALRSSHEEKARKLAGPLVEPNEAHVALDAIAELLLKLGNTRYRLKEWDRAIQDYEDARKFQSHKTWLGKEVEARAFSVTFRPIVEPDDDDDDEDYYYEDEKTSNDDHDRNDPTHSASTNSGTALELVKLKEMQMEGQILNNIASAYFRTFQYQTATTGYGDALKCKRQALRTTLKKQKERKSTGEDNVAHKKNVDDLHRLSILEISSTFHNIGLLRYKLSKFEKAVDAYKQSLLLRVERRGLNDLSVATTLGNLGDVYFTQGRYDSALRSYVDVLKILHSNVGKKHVRVANALHNIGLVHWAKGPYHEAKSALSKALKIRKKLLGNPNLEVSSTLYVLGLVLMSMGELGDAMNSLVESLNIRMKLCQPKGHLLILNSQLAIGMVHHKLGNLEEATAMFSTVLAERSRRLGKRHQAVSEVQQYIGLVYKDRGDYNQAIEALKDTLLIRESRFGRESEEAAETMNHLSVSYFKVGDQKMAMSLCRESLRILKKKKGKDHISIAVTLKHLGDIQQDLLQFENAIVSYQEVLRIRGNWLDHNHLDIGDTLNNIGNVWFKKGEFSNAKDVFKQALKIKKHWLDDDHISVITTLNNYGHALYKSCELDDALGSYKESLHYQLERLSDQKCDRDTDIRARLEHIRDKIEALSKGECSNTTTAAMSSSLGNIAATLRNIGLVHQDKGEFEKTMNIYKLILTVRKMQPVRDHAAIAMMAETIGMLQFKQGNYGGAMSSFHEALDIKEGIQGKNTVDVARTLNNLANVHFSRGSLDEATKMYRRALVIKRQSLGHDHDEVATTLNNIAHVLFTAGEDDESLQAYEEVLAIRKENLGEDHISISSTLSNMGDVHLKKGRLDFAKQFFERSIQIRKCHPEANIPDHARVLDKLALVYCHLCEWLNAEGAYYESLQLKRKILDRDHEEIAKTLEYLAASLIEQNHFDRAIPPLKEALHIRKLHVGENHEVVLTALNRIALVHRKAGKPELALNVYTEIERICKNRKQTHSEDSKSSDLTHNYSF